MCIRDSDGTVAIGISLVGIESGNILSHQEVNNRHNVIGIHASVIVGITGNRLTDGDGRRNEGLVNGIA